MRWPGNRCIDMPGGASPYPGLLLVLVGTTAALAWHVGATGLLALALLPLHLWRAHRIADASGHACNDRLVAWRTGWLSKRWSFAEIGKIQAVRLAQSPLDRRLGMASLLLDTGRGLGVRRAPVPAAAAGRRGPKRGW